MTSKTMPKTSKIRTSNARTSNARTSNARTSNARTSKAGSSATARDHLPLSAADTHLLLALSREEMYGYALLQAMDEDSRGAVGMDIGALYRALDRLMRGGLIGESDRRPEQPTRGKPRRYYRLTELGRDVLGAEMARLERVLAVAEGARS